MPDRRADFRVRIRLVIGWRFILVVLIIRDLLEQLG